MPPRKMLSLLADHHGAHVTPKTPKGDFLVHVASHFRACHVVRQGGLYVVAGLGIAPRPGGYEPPELLLLYPAVVLSSLA